MSVRILAGRYELLERIGDGGMAIVYKARCRLLNRFVAIKILKPDFIKDVKFIENFKKESQAAASLAHPNIVNVYDVGREGNIHYIVMELIEGKVLSEVIKEEAPLDYMRTIGLARQIASALSLAHKNHIIHRDVKPLNILITRDGTAKITDFGIAKAVNTSTLLASDGMVMGSVHYFSPEQARGGYVDEKSDIYSLGIVIYEMLTGKVPFDGDNPVSIALMHVNDEMTPPSSIVPGIPPRLEQIVMKATNKIQVNRFKSADEMLEALSNLEYMTGMVGGSAMGGVVEKESAEEAPVEKEVKEVKKEIENKGAKRRFKVNKMKIIAIILALICGIPASILLASFITGAGGGEGDNKITAIKEIAVPDVVGLTFERAEEELGKAGLQIQAGDVVISDEYDEGRVVSQSPAVDSIVKTGAIVTVNISKGAREGSIPRIIGMTRSDALFMIEKYGFKPGPVTAVKDNAPKGIVIRQTPEAGTEASPGATISFVVSDGKAEEEAIMPALVGMNIEDAKKELEIAGLKIGEKVTAELSTEYEKNQVIWQQYKAGDAVIIGSSVDLKISMGSEPPAPVSIPLEIYYAGLVENQVFFITVTITDEEGTRNVFTEQQRIKDDVGEIVSLSGTGTGTVTVIIDGQIVMKKNLDFNTGDIY